MRSNTVVATLLPSSASPAPPCRASSKPLSRQHCSNSASLRSSSEQGDVGSRAWLRSHADVEPSSAKVEEAMPLKRRTGRKELNFIVGKGRGRGG